MFHNMNFILFVNIIGLVKQISLGYCLTVNNTTANMTNEKEVSGTWEQDLADTFKIVPSTQGIKQVYLKCGAEAMVVELKTEDDFTGVMYTRGSFYKQAEPCFVKPKFGKSSRSLELKFPFDKCQTVKDGDLYSNVLVVQHDPELVMPGDSAFQLECDFRNPRDIKISADMKAREPIAIGSRIALTSPDPSFIAENNGLPSAYSISDSVTFIPQKCTETQQNLRGTLESVTLKRNDEL